jgi:DNA-binding transcriptional regulator YhcF (GntR family)
MRNKKDKAPRHVRICHYMMATPAWKSLGANPQAMYLDIASRYAGYGSNNGKICYSVRDAATNLHIGVATAKRALDALQDRGFIVAMKRGGFSLKQRHASEWRLTEFSSDISKDIATKDFMTWTPEKNKTRYPQRNRSVAVAEPIGSCSGTVQEQDTSHGSCSGTVRGVFGVAR